MLVRDKSFCSTNTMKKISYEIRFEWFALIVHWIESNCNNEVRINERSKKNEIEERSIYSKRKKKKEKKKIREFLFEDRNKKS